MGELEKKCSQLLQHAQKKEKKEKKEMSLI